MIGASRGPGHEFGTSTAPWRIHAAGKHSHRGLALSGRLAGHEFQPRAYEALHPDARAGEVRCLLHGRPHGRAQHAARCAQAQPHGNVVRAVHAALGAVSGHRAHRPRRHRLDHVRRALSRRAPLRLARSPERRPCRLEHRHHLEPGRGAQFRARRAHGAQRALSPCARVLRRGDWPVGQLGRRRLHPRRRERHLFRPCQAARARPQGRIPVRTRAVEHRAPGAGLAGNRAGRRLGVRPPARRRDRGGGVHGTIKYPRGGRSMPT